MAYRAARVFTVSYCGSSCSTSATSGFSQLAALHSNNQQQQKRRDPHNNSASSSMLAPSMQSLSLSQHRSCNTAATTAFFAASLRAATAAAAVSSSECANISVTYRERIQRLIGEAARADWQDVTKLYHVESSQDQQPSAATELGKEVACVSGISFEDAQRLHRLYYNHIMSDALAQYDSELFQARQNIARLEQQQQQLTMSPSLVSDRLTGVQKDLYAAVKARLAARMLWFSPVARCIESDSIDQLVEGLSNPQKFMEELQQSKERTLRQLTSLKLFL